MVRFDQRAQLVGRIGDVVAPAGDHLGGVLAGEEHDPAEDGRADGVERHLQRRHDAEVAASAAQPPVELGVVVGAGPHHRAVGGHHLGGEEVVAREAVGTNEVADAASQREPAQSRGRDQPAGGGQAVGLRGGVEPGPLRPAAGHRSARGGVHLDGRHRRQVDDDAIVAGGEAGDAVRSAPDGHRQALARREANGPDDVVGAGGTDDHRRVLVDGAVPDVARLLVLTVAGPHEGTRESPLELVDGRVAEQLCHVVLFRVEVRTAS